MAEERGNIWKANEVVPSRSGAAGQKTWVIFKGRINASK